MNKNSSANDVGPSIYADGKVIGIQDPEYAKLIGRAFVYLVQNLNALEEQNKRYRGLIERLLGDLKLVQTDLMAVSVEMEKIEKHGWLTKEHRTIFLRAQKIIHRFTGKKVSKERQAIYEEINKTVKHLRSQGAQGAFTEAVRIVAKKHKKQPEKLYRSFVKYKNRLYVKSPKRRQP